MKTLENNDWLTLNNIIYKIYTTEDFDRMREMLLEHLKMMIDFDSADFYLADPEKEDNLVNPVVYNCDENYSDQYEKLDYSKGILYGGRSMVYRETDIISDEKRVETEYYRKMYKPNGWHYSLQMVLGRRKKFLGVVTFYRTIGKEDFKYNDIFLLDMLKDHLAYRLDWEAEHTGTDAEKISIQEAAKRFDLTRRETTILQCLLQGMSNEEISHELVISVNTIKKHILNLYRKLGINSRVQMFKMIRECE